MSVGFFSKFTYKQPFKVVNLATYHELVLFSIHLKRFSVGTTHSRAI